MSVANAVKAPFAIGTRVRVSDPDMHDFDKRRYPIYGSIGIVTGVDEFMSAVRVFWQTGSKVGGRQTIVPCDMVEALQAGECPDAELKPNMRVVRREYSKKNPRRENFEPPAGTVGTVLLVKGEQAFIRWARGTTSQDDCWWSNFEDIEFIK